MSTHYRHRYTVYNRVNFVIPWTYSDNKLSMKPNMNDTFSWKWSFSSFDHIHTYTQLHISVWCLVLSFRTCSRYKFYTFLYVSKWIALATDLERHTWKLCMMYVLSFCEWVLSLYQGFYPINLFFKEICSEYWINTVQEDRIKFDHLFFLLALFHPFTFIFG